jgi:flagellar basal-body rod modification protein FlgD
VSNSLLAGATTAAAASSSSTSASSSSSSSSASSGKTTGIASGMGQDAFLKMFMAQMTNQNPLDPMDNTQFTAQLAQFSSLEQLTQINKNLSGLTTLTDAVNQTQAMSYLGKDVTLSGGQLPVNGGVAGATNFTLPSSASVKIAISDSAGKVIATRNLGTVAAGDQSFTWDGLKDSGAAAADGVYTVTISATDGDGGTVKVSNQTVTGKVTGFKKGSDGTTYLMSGMASWAKVSDIVSVNEPKATSNATALTDWLTSQAQNATSSGQSFNDWLQSLVNSYSGS